jgi:hypothetical protein
MVEPTRLRDERPIDGRLLSCSLISVLPSSSNRYVRRGSYHRKKHDLLKRRGFAAWRERLSTARDAGAWRHGLPPQAVEHIHRHHHRYRTEGSEEIQKRKVAGFLFGYMGEGKH